MRSSTEPPPRPGEGIIEEFPAYVPWKAEQRPYDDSICTVCLKCRCAVCQKMCKYPGMRVCGVLDMQPRWDEACIETTAVFVPCVQKTARCPASDAARAEAYTARAQAAAAAATDTATDNDTATADTATAADTATTADTATAADIATAADTATATPEGSGRNPTRERATSGKCRLRCLLRCFCCPCPYCTVDDELECSPGCRGNASVYHCECVDWEELRQHNRRRVNEIAAAVAASRDQRRCRDYHYYLTEMPRLENNTSPASAVPNKIGIRRATTAVENVGTATPTEKKNRLRKFLRF